jgi:hypothetical protein
MEIGVWVKSYPEGVYLFVNRKFCESTNTYPDEVVGKTDYDLWGKEIGDDYAIHDRAAALKREPIVVRGDILQPDGSKSEFKKIKFPLIEGDKVVAIGGIARDLNEQGRFWEYIQHTVEDLERMLKEDQ